MAGLNRPQHLRLSEIIDTNDIQSLIDSFFSLTNIPAAIIDIEGNILAGAGGQIICTNFHRACENSCKNCIESDTILASGIPEGEYKLYKCKNGMYDIATPIIIEGTHLGNLFMGQFLLNNETVDTEYFKRQAKLFGYDEEQYLKALGEVPMFDTAAIEKASDFFLKFAKSISKLSYSNLKLSAVLNERDSLLGSLQQSEEQLRDLFNELSAVMIIIDPETGIIKDANPSAVEFYGWTKKQFLSMSIQDITIHKENGVVNKLRSLSTGKKNVFVFAHWLADGQTRWVEVYPSLMAGDGKELIFMIIHDITQRKMAEVQLRKLSGAVEQSPNSIIITDVKGNIEYANPRFEELTGYKSKEIIGRNPRFMKSGRTKPEVYKDLWETITGGRQWRGELLNKKKSGELYWESVNISPVKDENDIITHFTAVKEDITGQKMHEDMLKRLNRILNALIHSGDAIANAFDEKDYLNKVCRILVEDCGHALIWIGFAEHNKEKSVKLAASAGFDDEYIKSLEITWDNTERGRGPTGTAIRTGEISSCNNILTDPNYKPWRDEAVKHGYVSSIALPLKKEGSVFGAISIYSKEINVFSKDEINLLSELADNVAYGITVIRLREEHLVTENELKYYRNHLEDLVVQRTKELEMANKILKTVQDEIEQHKINLEGLVKTRTQQLNKANRKLKDEIEKEKQVEMLLKKSLDKERDLNELKSRFISTTSHEFRTPLTSVLSSMQLIQKYRKKWSDDKLEEMFLRVKNSIFNLTKLLDDILMISHADSGKIVLNPEKIDLHQFMLEIIEETKHRRSSKHKFVYDFQSVKTEFYLDRKLIRFILINLLSNAFKYSPEGGIVELTVSSGNGNLSISVSDEGIGIPAKDKKNLFKPFFRSSNTNEIEGTGLGLSIVQRAVDLHKGNIICNSKVGKGTKFIVKIPGVQ